MIKRFQLPDVVQNTTKSENNLLLTVPNSQFPIPLFKLGFFKLGFFKNYFYRFYLSLSILGVSWASILMTITPAKAADEVIFSSPLGDFTLPVESLETYAKEGRQDKDFAYYAKFIPKEELPRLRELLQRKVPVTPIQMSQFLYSSMGKMALEYIGEYVRTDSRLNGFYATRAALILAATEPDGLGIIDFLRKFPSRTMRVNSDAAFKIFGAVTDLYDATDKASDLIAKQAFAETGNNQSIVNQDIRQSGQIKWQKITNRLVDQQRLLNTNQPRQFNVDLYLPEVKQPAPLIVISHGFGSDRTDFIYLAEHLASYGFAVAVLDHPGSSNSRLQAFLRGEVTDATEAREFIDRPKDISFLLDELTKLNQSQLNNKINLQKIGIIGHSFGGYTSLAVAGAEFDLPMLRDGCRVGNFNLNDANTSYLLQCLAQNLPTITVRNLQDKRISGVFAINPVGAGIFGKTGIAKIKIPTVIAASSNDVIAPAVIEQICPYTWLQTPEKTLVYTKNGSHIDANQNSGSSSIPLESNIASSNPQLARNYYQVIALAFAQTYIANNPQYQSYLQPQYATKISQREMPLFIIKNLNTQQIEENLDIQCLGEN